MASVDRRRFLKLMGAAGLAAFAPLPVRSVRAQTVTGPYEGPLFVQVAAEGGWDVTSFCDPKVNTPGNPVINHWAQSSPARTISGSPITYAPFAQNESFFQRFHQDMLVINGVDAQTDSHETGVRHNWSGRISHGYPSWAALVAGAYGQDLPLPFVTNGGYRETGGVTQYTLLGDTSALVNLSEPNKVPWGDEPYHETDELDVITAYRQARLDRLAGRTGNLPRRTENIDALLRARANNNQLVALAERIPDQLVSPVDVDGFQNWLLPQAQMALIAFDSGLTVSAHLQTWGFDTHTDHDNLQGAEMGGLTRGIEYLWDTAEAMGLADRLVVVVNSDFGRTPWYNQENGKDHWPIGSTIIMARGVDWTNRVIGATTETHEALALDPRTLQPSTAGVRIEPRHVQRALRQVAGIESDSVVDAFPLDGDDFDFFDASLGSTSV